jgi:hypothetical protein
MTILHTYQLNVTQGIKKYYTTSSIKNNMQLSGCMLVVRVISGAIHLSDQGSLYKDYVMSQLNRPFVLSFLNSDASKNWRFNIRALTRRNYYSYQFYNYQIQFWSNDTYSVIGRAFIQSTNEEMCNFASTLSVAGKFIVFLMI